MKKFELINMYADLIEKQDDIIHDLASLVKRLSVELAHYKTISGVIDMNNTEQQEMEETFEKIEDYKNNLEP